MLSRKSGPGLLSAAASIDRGRVGERLQAALAGLQELHYLKEKQSHMVHWALRMDREEPLSCDQRDLDGSVLGTEEQRLEATLAALKQQLLRLRRQDVGLKSHLQQLDQQISELKLDVRKASSEHLESDSRPSSGFYELSDGGSGSLSNSCTSVNSECLSSSQNSLLPTPCSPGLLTQAPGRPAEALRPRSAGENASPGEPPRVGVVRQVGSRIRTGVTDRAKSRPVSTGDLERLLTPCLGLYRSIEVKKTLLCNNVQHPALNPKYQSDLVSRSGAEVYRYPSPLHAVALQSPMFSLNVDEVGMPAETQDGATQIGGSQEVGSECKPVDYISKVLQCSLSKANLILHQPSVKSQNEDTAVGNGASTVLCALVPKVKDQTPHMDPQDLPSEAEKTSTAVHCVQLSDNRSSGLSQVENELMSYCPLYPEDPPDPKPQEVPAHSARPGEGKEASGEQPQLELGGRDAEIVPSVKIPCVARSSNVEEGRECEKPLHATQPEFVHAQFVPAGSRHVKVRQADRKTKAVKLRKRSTERPRPGRQQLHVQFDREKEPSNRAAHHADRAPKQAGDSRVSGNPPARLHSESNSTHQFTRQLEPTTKVKKNPRLPHPRLEHVHTDTSKKRQAAWRWQITAETGPWPASLGMPQGHRSREIPGTTRRMGLTRSTSMRPPSGPWTGPPLTIHPSASSSHFSGYAFRYTLPSEPERSEYSADRLSLFHSTIAESSEGDLSDFTANRFGDSESSQGSQSPGDSDSSLSLEYDDDEEEEEEERGLVWAEAAVGPTGARVSLHQPRPEPPPCRIKASRALKKKIRRFQPASLKVMTLV